MKLFITVIMVLCLTACATQQKVPSLKDAASQGDIDSGFYNKKNGENVYVDVQSMRQKAEDAEKKAYEAQREADYNKLKAQQLQDENTLLRARGNYKLEKQVNEIQGFDNHNNPVVKQKTLDLDPAERPEAKVRYIDNAVMPTKVKYIDPNRLTNETSVAPGRGVPAPKVEPVEAAPPAAQPVASASVEAAPKVVEAARAPASLEKPSLVSELPPPQAE